MRYPILYNIDILIMKLFEKKEKYRYLFNKRISHIWKECISVSKNLEKKRDYRKRTIGHKVNQEDSPKISVIVSLAGKRKLCEQKRLSLLNQGYRNFEVVLAGNLM